MKKPFLTSIFCIVSGFYGCSEDGSDPVSPGTTVDHGYYPLAKGSGWTYDAVQEGRPAQVIHQVSGDSIINSKKYMRRVLATNGQLQYSFMRRSNDTIFTYSFSEETPGEKILLIEKNAGTTWSSYQADLGYEVTTTYHIIAKLPSRKVYDIEYKDVLQVQMNQSISGWGQSGTRTFNVYFAKNIGLIATEGNIDYARLTKYTIQ